ncbi:18407_t:CDS:1, partial [Racocetra persica]
MGSEKKKLLEKFPVLKFISGIREEIEKLWRKFYQLYQLLKTLFPSDDIINRFEIDAKKWICTFYKPAEGAMNSTFQKPGLYRKEDISPYMH